MAVCLVCMTPLSYNLEVNLGKFSAITLLNCHWAGGPNWQLDWISFTHYY